LWLIELLLFLLLVPLIVQADPPVTTDAFWMTRPIPPQRLLSDKALLLWTALALLPISVEAVVMVALYHVALGDGVLAALANLLVQTFVLMILMAVASLTPTLSTFVLVWVGTLFSLVLLTVAYRFFIIASFRQAAAVSVDVLPWRGTSDSSDVIVFMLVGIAAAALTLVVQYRRRSWIQSVSIAVLGAAVAVGAGSQWPWPLIRGSEELPPWARQSSTLTLFGDANDVRLAREPYPSRPTQPWCSLTAGLRVLAIPDGWSADVQLMTARVILDDGTNVSTGRGNYSAAALAGDDRVSAYSIPLKLMGVKGLARPTGDYVGPSVLTMPDGDYRRLDSRTARYEGQFQVALNRHEIAAALPLRAGAVAQRGPFRIAIDRVALVDRVPSILVRESDTHSIFHREQRGRRTYYLRNRLRSEAVPLSSANGFRQAANDARAMPFVVFADSDSGFTATAMNLDFDHDPNTGVPPIDADWLEGAELIVVVTTYHGTVDRTLVMDRIEMPANVVSRSEQ
jgi:hypothetical protein